MIFFNQTENEEHWLSVSDLMSALMMIFLLLSLFFLIDIDEAETEVEKQTSIAETSNVEKQALIEELQQEKERVTLLSLVEEEAKEEKRALLDQAMALRAELEQKNAAIEKQGKDFGLLLVQLQENAKKLNLKNVSYARLKEQIGGVLSAAVVYEDLIAELYQALLTEFEGDFEKWNAELREDLTFRFKEPSYLFNLGDATLKPRFRAILDDFFPRYLKVITRDEFKNDIAEVRIEGHTSSIWGNLPPDQQSAYFNNMVLSQSRSSNTLFYVMERPSAVQEYRWLKDKLTANGLSSSKLVDDNGVLLSSTQSTGVENASRSQRVEFRVRIDAESKITKIIDSGTSS